MEADDKNTSSRISIRNLGVLTAFAARPTAVFLAISWILSVFFFLVFLKNSGWIPKSPTTVYDLAYLLVSLVYFVLPFVSSVKVGGILEIKRTRPIAGNVPAQQVSESNSEDKRKTATELKILNTLWNRQVVRFPDLNKFWTFRLSTTSPEFLQFREAGNRLMGQGLIAETDKGQFRLTKRGLHYCAEHYEEFPPDMWFEYIPLTEDNLQRLRAKLD